MKLFIKEHKGNETSKVYREVVNKKGRVIIKELLYYENEDIIIRQAMAENNDDIKAIYKIMRQNNYKIKRKALKNVIVSAPLENFVYVVTDKKGIVLAAGQMKYSFENNVTKTKLYKSKQASKKQISEIKMEFQKIKFCDKLVFEKK